MHYIREVQVGAPGTHNQHVTAVRYAATLYGPLSAASREQVHAWITQGNPFRTFDSRTGAQASVAARTTSSGTRYIATVADGIETNNLLSLPRY
jgi:hypothetical protein